MFTLDANPRLCPIFPYAGLIWTEKFRPHLICVNICMSTQEINYLFLQLDNLLYIFSSEEGERGVYARKYIPAKSIVIVESGQNFQFSAPFMNCEMCGAYEENLYTCSECRSKCYCSNACLKYDWEEHQHECYGYRIGIIPMFEAKMLFRFFVQAAKCLSPALAAYTLQNGYVTWLNRTIYSRSSHCKSIQSST